MLEHALATEGGALPREEASIYVRFEALCTCTFPRYFVVVMTPFRQIDVVVEAHACDAQVHLVATRVSVSFKACWMRDR